MNRAGDRRIIHVVSYLARSPFAPRGIRTRRIVDALAQRSEVDVIFGPTPLAPGRRVWARRAWDYGLYRLYAALAMDRYETWSIRRLSGWRPEGDGALLIGYPFSPVTYAASALRRHGVPYVVDIGDPWTLTARVLGTEPHSQWRGRRAERAVWAGAAGAILTTEQQAAALTQLFPSLPTLVRPNGYDEANVSSLPARVPPAGDELHLGHFGRLYGPRIDIGGALTGLVRDGRWRRVVVHQFGEVERGTLDSLPRDAHVIIQPARPWPEIRDAAARLSAVLVVGNLSPAQLPSKVVDYLTLPAPRVALVREEGADAIADYLRDKRGWLVAAADAPDLGARIGAHVSREWTEAELAPPPEEAWPTVGERVAEFIDERLGMSRSLGSSPR